jgi:hypothetical protein
MPVSDDTAIKDPSMPPSKHLRAQVLDALELLEYAVASGFKAEDGHSVPADIISAIKTIAAKLNVVGEEEKGSEPILSSEWVAFEVAYYRLTTLMAPITVDSLRCTAGTGEEPSSTWRKAANLFFGIGYSPAQKFTRTLWTVAIAFAVLVLASEWALRVMALAANAADDRAWARLRTLLELVTPYFYGGLGSCVYLLRSAHTFIYKRTFDLRRKPEYFNRILLGSIAGGAIILFYSQVAGEGGELIQLSSAALGFLAGYSTDFLYSTIERIIAALLPKAGLPTIARARPATPILDARDLADRYERATGPDKDFYKALLEQIVGRR